MASLTAEWERKLFAEEEASASEQCELADASARHAGAEARLAGLEQVPAR